MENTVNPSLQSTSKNTSIFWTIVLLICTFGLWSIYLTFRWAKNLNYLEHSEKYNPWAISAAAAGGMILSLIELFTTGSWFLDLLGLILSNGIFLFLMVKIKEVCDRQNTESGTRKQVFTWLVILFVIETAASLFTLGHHDCTCVLCSIGYIFFAVEIGYYCLLGWLFNKALEDEKITSNIAVNEGVSNGAWIFGIIAVLLAVVILGIMASGDDQPAITVAEFREQAEQEINKALSTSDHNMRKYVENAHKTVTVHTAYVSDLQITTKDGTNNAGVGGKNIRRLHLEITTRWDGLIHKNGFTVIGTDLENINNEWKVTNSGIIKTDAIVNTEDPKFWYEVGAAAALLLF